MKQPKTRRKLKVYSKYTSNKSHSEIRLSGKWLEKSGFNAGDDITLFIRMNTIVIIRGGKHKS